jgi:hypothetical protein
VVAVGVSPAVEGGILPPDSRFGLGRPLTIGVQVPPGETPGSTAGEDAYRYA